ncbi:MAG: phosphoribosyltransferase family protein [Acidobacteriota bacterium]
MSRSDDVRRQALVNLKDFEVLMVDGHFDYGNGYHGQVYLNPHKLFRQPSAIWRFAQDVLDILPETVIAATDVVVGPVMGGALLAHTIAGLMDGRRSLTHPQCSFAPISVGIDGTPLIRTFYKSVLAGTRVLLVDDVQNTGKTFEKAKSLIEAAGGQVIATAEIYDRMEAIVNLGVPNYALAEYKAPDNHLVADCPMCQAGTPITTF